MVIPSHNDRVCGLNPYMQHQNDLYLFTGTAPTNCGCEIDFIRAEAKLYVVHSANIMSTAVCTTCNLFFAHLNASTKSLKACNSEEKINIMEIQVIPRQHESPNFEIHARYRFSKSKLDATRHKLSRQRTDFRCIV